MGVDVHISSLWSSGVGFKKQALVSASGFRLWVQALGFRKMAARLGHTEANFEERWSLVPEAQRLKPEAGLISPS
jgi:hypothetical protein